MDLTPASISQLVNTGTLVAFIVLIVGLIIAALVGMKRGIFAATFRLVITAVLVLTAILTLNPLVEAVSNFDLSKYLHYAVTVTNPETGVVYYAPLTTVRETVEEVLKGYFVVFNAYGSIQSASNYIYALASSIIKLAVFFVDILLIVLLGWLLAFLLWHIFFKHSIPKLARKKAKFRLIAAIEGMAKYSLVAFMLLSPLTSLVNSFNQSYQKTKEGSDDSKVTLVSSALDAYNNSIFANAFFNWTVNDDGLTIDSAFLDSITKSTAEDVTISLVDEMTNLTDVAVVAAGAITGTSGDMMSNIDATMLASSQTIKILFDAIENSNIVTLLIPVVAQMALNSDLLASKVPLYLVQMDDVNWKMELQNIEDMALAVVNSGIINEFIDADGHFTFGKEESKKEVKEYVNDIFGNTNYYNGVKNAIQQIDGSTLLSRAVPALISWVGESVPTIKEILPTSWDVLSDISWGHECGVILSTVKQMYDVDPTIVDAIFNLGKTSEASPSDRVNPKKEDTSSETTDPTLFDIIFDNVSAYKSCIVGTFNGGEPANIDKYGRTVVYDDNGNKIEGREYCLMDLSLMKYSFEKIMGLLTDVLNNSGAGFTDSDIANVKTIAKQKCSGAYAKNIKKEFNAILGMVESVALNDTDGDFKAFINGFDSSKLMSDPNDPTSLKPGVVKALRTAMPKIDDSDLLYALLTPIIKNNLSKPDITNKLFEFGIDADIMIDGMNKCIDNRTLGAQFAEFLRIIPNISALKDVLGSGTTAQEMVNKLGQKYKNIAQMLDIVCGSEIINPDPVLGDYYSFNENYYNVLDFVFSNTSSLGLTFHRYDFEAANKPKSFWINQNYDADDNVILNETVVADNAENGRVALALKTVAQSNSVQSILNGTDVFADKTVLQSLSNDLPAIIKAMANSSVFKATLGEFMDHQLQSTPILDAELNVCFANVNDWNTEADNLGDMLNTVSVLYDSLCTGGSLSFDFTKVNDIVSLNNLLHNLANSGIFVDRNKSDSDPTRYTFGTWLYVKMTSSIGSMSFDFSTDPAHPDNQSFNLFADPADYEWADYQTSWQDQAGAYDWKGYYDANFASKYADSQFISFRDFACISKSEWSNATFRLGGDFAASGKFETLKDAESAVAAYGTNYWENASFKALVSGDDGYFAYDEISSIVGMIFNAKKLMDSSFDISTMTADTVGDILYSMNASRPMRTAIYSFYNIATKLVSSQGGSSFNLEGAYNSYLISCDYKWNQFDYIKSARKVEISKLVDVFDAYTNLKDIIGGSGDMMSKISADSDKFMTSAKACIEAFASSQVFHQKGSGLKQKEYNTTHTLTKKFYPTVFQEFLTKLYNSNGMKAILYNENSPKDIMYKDTYLEYKPSASTTSELAEAKSAYVIDTQFPSDGVAISYTSQISEINKLIDLLGIMVGSGTSKGLVNSSDERIYEIGNADFTKTDNIETISDIFELLNTTNTLCDGLPNAIEVALSGISISGIHMNYANVFYHYGMPSTTLVTAADFNFNAKYADEDVDLFINLISENAKGSDSILNKVADLTNLNAAAVSALGDFVEDLMRSEIFHNAGARKTLTLYDASTKTYSYVVDSITNTFGYSFVQDIFASKIYGASAFDIVEGGSTVGNYIYYNYMGSIESPKDEYMKNTVHAYTDATTKAEYMTKQYFPANQDTSGLDSEVGEFNKILNVITALSGMQLNDFDMNNLSDDKINQIEDILTALNNSETLKDMVPNYLHHTFNATTLNGLDEVHLSDATVYFHFKGMTTAQKADFKAYPAYPQSEVVALCDVMRAFKDFSDVMGSGSLNSVSSIKAVVSDAYGNYSADNVFRTLMYSIYNTNSCHLQNEYRGNPDHLTVFEQTIYQIVKCSTLSEMMLDASATDAAREAFAKAKIKAVSAFDNVPSSVNTTGYHTKWLSDLSSGSSYQECESILYFCWAGTSVMDPGASFNIDSNISFTNLNPDNFTLILNSLNGSDIASTTLPQIIKKAYAAIGINTKVSYNSVLFANYNIGQYLYGGKVTSDVSETATNIANSEISVLKNVLDTLWTGTGYADISDLTGFSSAQLESILQYFVRSEILSGTQQISSIDVSARAVLMYNLFDGGTVSATSYLTGSTSDEKILSLNNLFKINQDSWTNGNGTAKNGLDYETENASLFALLGQMGNLNSIDTSSVSSVRDSKDLLFTMMQACYNADGSDHRSYLTSEIVSGLLQNFVNQELTKGKFAVSPGWYYDDLYFGPASYSAVNATAYDELNVHEANGIYGLLDLTSVFNGSMPSASDEATINNCFSLSTWSDGMNEYNAKISIIIYHAELAGNLENLHTALTISKMGVTCSELTSITTSLGGVLCNVSSTPSLTFADFGTALTNYMFH